jgi:hypothetical protein
MHERPVNVTVCTSPPAILTVLENKSPEPVVAGEGALEAGVELGFEDGVGVGVGAGVELGDDESL